MDLDAEERGRAVSSWRGRMVSEYVSARVFAALVPQAMRASLPHRSVRDLTRMATEEISHAELCADVLVNLDGNLPPAFSRFERLLEIVGTDEADRGPARERFKFYRDRGYAIAAHDLSKA